MLSNHQNSTFPTRRKGAFTIFGGDPITPFFK